MKAFVQSGVSRYAQEEVERPRPAAGQIVLRVGTAVTCGTDLKLLARGHPRIGLPVTMGHELAGEVAEIGEGVRGWTVGERAVPGVSGPCGRCGDCGSGRANLCASGHADRMWGAFAEYVRVPAGVVAANLHRIPDGLDDEVAAFLDPVASVFHGWNRLRAPSGSMLVYGAGALGFLWASVASRRGLDVVIASRRPERAALARQYGARFVDLTRESPPAADVAVDCTGQSTVWERLAELVRPGGQVLLFGGCAPDARVGFDAARLHYGELSLVGAFHYTPEDARGALDALAAGDVDPRPLIAERGSFEDLPRFLDAQARGEGVRYAIAVAGGSR